MPDPVPIPEDLPKLPIIVVRGQRQGRPPAFGEFTPGAGIRARDLAVGGFVAPATAPVIEEIVATASRPPPPVGTGFAAATRVLGLLGIGISGIYLLDRAAQKIRQDEDELKRKLARDREIQRAAQEMSAEITVRAKRLPEPEPLVLPPLPTFIPKKPLPRHLQPIQVPARPFIMPTPQVIPDVAIPAPAPAFQPLVAPATPGPAVLPELLPTPAPFEVPLPRAVPQRRPQTQPSRRARPDTQPQTQPLTSPAPATQPATQPAVRAVPQVQTRTTTGMQSMLEDLTRAQARALASTEGASRFSVDDQIQRCKSEIDEPRDRCYKKLLREALFPEFDEEYEWAEIDCITGREI